MNTLSDQRVLRFIQEERNALWITMAIASFMALFRLGGDPIHMWDEARYGAITVEMLQRGDWIHYYFAGRPDTVVSKPPLLMWSIALCYQVFGYNEWALRLPSALAIIGTFYFLFRIITRYRSPHWALLTCLILMTGKGLIGHHVGRTGDADAMLTFFLVGSTYWLIRAIDDEQWRSMGGVGLFLGLAFLTKGTAAAILLPGWLLYVIIRKKIVIILKQPWTWIGVLTGLAFVIGWSLTLHFSSSPVEGMSTTTPPRLARLIFHDTFQRFFGDQFSSPQSEWGFFFVYLDTRLNLWNYIFYLFGGWGVVSSVRRSQWKFQLPRSANLPVLALCCWIPFTLFQTFSITQHHWYMAPVLPFIGITLMELIRWGYDQWKKSLIIVLMLLAFTLGRRIYQIGTPGHYPDFLKKATPYLQKAQPLISFKKPRHDYLLYLYFQNPQTKVVYSVKEIRQRTNDSSVIFTRNYRWNEQLSGIASLRPILRGENYLIATKNTKRKDL